MSERILGDDRDDSIDLRSDLFGKTSNWTEDSFRNWCRGLTEQTAAQLPLQDSNGGMTWLEGNMNWTRYNHLLPPNRPSCKNGITWEGVAMTASSKHDGGVNILMGDASVRFINEDVDSVIWSATASIRGREPIAFEW